MYACLCVNVPRNALRSYAKEDLIPIAAHRLPFYPLSFSPMRKLNLLQWIY